MAAIKYSGNVYSATRDGDRIAVSVQFRYHTRSAQLHENEAYRWLGDHGLRRGKIRKLIAAIDKPAEKEADTTACNYSNASTR